MHGSEEQICEQRTYIDANGRPVQLGNNISYIYVPRYALVVLKSDELVHININRDTVTLIVLENLLFLPLISLPRKHSWNRVCSYLLTSQAILKSAMWLGGGIECSTKSSIGWIEAESDNPDTKVISAVT